MVTTMTRVTALNTLSDHPTPSVVGVPGQPLPAALESVGYQITLSAPQAGPWPADVTAEAGQGSHGPAMPGGSNDSLDADVSVLLAHSQAPNTVKKDAGAWRKWRTFCALEGVHYWLAGCRGQSHALVTHEERLLVRFLVHTYRTMLPRKGADAAARPASAVAVLSALRRIHRHRGVDLPKPAAIKLAATGMMREFVALHGADALQPQRKEPLTPAMLVAIRLRGEGCVALGRVVRWVEPLWCTFWALMLCMLAAAFRKAGACASSRHAPPPLTQGSLVLHDRWASITPPPCKNDPFGAHFASEPIILHGNGGELDPLAALRAMRAARPSPQQCAPDAPLFAHDDGSPITCADLDLVFRALVRTFMPEEMAARYSPHSFRIGAATRLLQLGVPHETIMRVCRWRSAGCVQMYARMEPEERARFTDQILSDGNAIRAATSAIGGGDVDLGPLPSGAFPDDDDLRGLL